MCPPDTLTFKTAPVDPDLAEQAAPGHGVTSQDPDPAAQFPLEPLEAQREGASVLPPQQLCVPHSAPAVHSTSDGFPFATA